MAMEQSKKNDSTKQPGYIITIDTLSTSHRLLVFDLIHTHYFYVFTLYIDC